METTIKAQALALFDQGIPVTIEDETLRAWLNAHRWGHHTDKNDLLQEWCPACEREVKKAGA